MKNKKVSIEERIANILIEAEERIHVPKQTQKILSLIKEVAESIIGEYGATNTGLGMIDEPNTYNNLLRKEQRKALSVLLGEDEK